MIKKVGYETCVLIVMDRFRQYGLWERYAELYPDNDLVYTIGVSDYTKDFFFAQVTRFSDSSIVLIRLKRFHETADY